MSGAGHDVAVVGAGIVGLATAHALVRARPGLRIVVVEKEGGPAQHQSGRNSGVIHAGLYYTPGSLKAQLTHDGARRMIEFCAQNEIPTTQTGKLVVATDREQVPALNELERRAMANGVASERVGPAGIREHEPHAAGIDALWVPFTGAVDFSVVAARLAGLLHDDGVRIAYDFPVARASQNNGYRTLEGDGGEVSAKVVVNCAGLHVDRVAQVLGLDPGLRILPFRGEYYGLSETAADMVRGHIYPVPDSRLPHLGVHFTRSVDGRVEVGPNAVWAWGREAYRRLSGRPRDAWETLSYRGFWRLARQHWRAGAEEQWRSLNRRSFVRRARRLVPDLESSQLGAYRSGVRAQAVAEDGSLISDFVFRDAPGVVSVLNAPSPAATACLTIGEHIAARVISQLD